MIIVKLVINKCSACADVVLPDLQEAFGHKRGYRFELRISLIKAHFCVNKRLNNKNNELLFR